MVGITLNTLSISVTWHLRWYCRSVSIKDYVIWWSWVKKNLQKQPYYHLLSPEGFLVFASILLLACLVMIFYFSPRIGHTNILIYISICSLLGAFTVSSVKGLGIFLRTVVVEPSVLSHPLTWILLLTLVASVIIQINYLNKSLDTFNTLLVYPIYYVFFTTVVLSTSIILFKEWGHMSAVDVVGTIGSFLVIVLGVSMLHLFKDLRVTLDELRNNLCQPQALDSPGKREDKHILIENVDSLPPMREEGPRVFIISWAGRRLRWTFIKL